MVGANCTLCNQEVCILHDLGVAGRWYWCVKMPENKVAALPSAIALHVERLICIHRKERKTILESATPGWQEKLVKINGKVMTIVWQKKTAAIAKQSYVKSVTKMVNGELQFQSGSGKGYELIRLCFKPAVDGEPSGPGHYWLTTGSHRKIILLVKFAA